MEVLDGKKYKNKGFTLIEALGTLIILAVLTLIAVPIVNNVIMDSRKESFAVNAKIILKQALNEKTRDQGFDLSEVNPENMFELLAVAGNNYSSVEFKEYNDRIFINVLGANKWEGLSACGAYDNLLVVEGECELDSDPPEIIFNPDGSNKYIKSSSVQINVKDPFLDEKSLKYVWTNSEIMPNEEGYVNSFVNSENVPMPFADGSFYLHVIAKDTLNNSTQDYRNFLLDNTAPVITIIGEPSITINKGTVYVDAGATAVDDVDGDVTNKIIVTGSVNTKISGTYKITYTVSDAAGNKSTITRTVNVIDNVGPTIVFGTNGNNTYQKSHSTKVTVSDAHSNISTSSLKYQWTTNTTPPSEATFTNTFTNGETISSPSGVSGTYYLWILAKDKTGNVVIVRSNGFNLDNTKPVITLNGQSTVTIDLGSSYTDAGATASDAHSGLDGNVVVNNPVNPNQSGTYTITYNISDKAGNAATQVTRIVVVNEVTQYRYRTSSQSCSTCYSSCPYTCTTSPNVSYYCSAVELSLCNGNQCCWMSGYPQAGQVYGSATPSYSCPSGYSLSGSTCQKTCYQDCNPYSCNCTTSWSGWSTWSTTPVTQTSTREVQTRQCTSWPCPTT